MATAPLTLTLVNTGRRFGLTRKRITDYSSLLGGQVGRLVFSLIYFVTLTRALSLGDFGIFATCSAIGIVLSRLAGFGFMSPLYRVSVTRPRLIGAYTSAYLVALLASIPFIVAIAWALYTLLYLDLIILPAFLLIIFAEVLLWRTLEMAIIVNNGLDKFLTGSLLTIGGVAAKALMALWFLIHGGGDIALWAGLYFATNGLIALFAIAFFYPKQRLKWRPRAWAGRARDAVGVSAAEALFYVQSELDKVLVLALGGEIIAGIYAIIMRLVDLTAMPLRALSTLLTQWIMRSRQTGKPTRHGLLIDLLVGFTSSAALAAAALILWFIPDVVGENITMASAFLPLLLLVPAFRNAIEYHTELLYAHELMGVRVILLIYIGTLKAVLLWSLLGSTTDFATMAIWLNTVFGALWLASALVTYGRLRVAKGKVLPVDQPPQ
ncbi:MAG: lipopolysaccharide biosynthesis protein [Rhizobiaceae bacterium]